jgi:periplasmic divalent cation tolerance protein
MREGDSFVLVFVTVPPGEPAERLARSLVDSELAACVNRIGGIRSIYRWKGETHAEGEEMLVIKSSRRLLDLVEKHVKEHHPYEVPEILAVPISCGSAPYLNWLAGSLRRE